MRNAWIKFEGNHEFSQPHKVISVKDGDKTLYILNYVKRPTGVKDDETVFISSGITDNNINQQSIVGRGVLCKFQKSNEVKPEWVDKYPWMSHYKYYLVLKELECVDAPRKDSLFLNQVLETIGANTYPSSIGKDVTLKQLRQKHTQKMHLRITEEAKNYINRELNKVFETYGSSVYYSEI